MWSVRSLHPRDRFDLFSQHQFMTITDIPKIRGISEIPGALPIFGHLLALGEDHATVCEVSTVSMRHAQTLLSLLLTQCLQKWWRKYRHSIFQIRLGNTRAVVVNNFDDCKRMLIGNQSAVIDRPTLYTFHGVISSTQGFTIGSSPWDESCKVSLPTILARVHGLVADVGLPFI